MRKMIREKRTTATVSGPVGQDQKGLTFLSLEHQEARGRKLEKKKNI